MSSIKMIKLDMSDIPEENIPTGFELRVIQSGDKSKWKELCDKAFNDSFEFTYNIENRTGYIEDGVFVIADGDKIIATSTAFHNTEQADDCGYLEFIAVNPAYSDKQLGYEITAAALRRLRGNGVKKVELSTWDFCLPAIKIYLKLGFTPDYSIDETMHGRWESIYAALANKINFDDEIKEIIIKAEQGDVDAQLHLSEHFYEIHKFDETVKWLTKAAEQGHIEAQRSLGDYYCNGEIIEQDYEKGVLWLTKAAEQGHGYAQFNLACHYIDGNGVEPSPEQAVKWFAKAAEQGMADAQYCMGIRYWYGDGVGQDYGQAAKWFTKAATQEDYPQCQEWEVKMARGKLAFMHYCGYGVARDYEQAKEWYGKAAKMGDETANQMLKLMTQSQRKILKKK